ncbi:MAG: exonuclease domain-containing protein [Clostridiales bacterium]|nr:exonuclease domain-containing protein [Clostridiales bacterium]
MIKDYISVDIENPNTRGNSICSIGIIIVKDNKIIDKKYSLINPEDRFDINNSKITGLTYADVKDAPTFKEYWKTIEDLFKNNVIVGHNITYDLSVISKALERYDIDAPVFNYYCTLKLSRKYINTNSYSLDSLCDLLKINLDNHHNALEDALASQQIFEYLNKRNDIGNSEKFEFINKVSDSMDSKLETNINTLYGIIKGINYDGIIDDKEIEKLRLWVEDNRLYKQYSLFDKIINKLEEILEDNVITEYERIELEKLVTSINESKIYSESTLALQILNGILDGIVCNQKVNQKEIENLNIWLRQNDYLKDVYPYDKVLLEVNKVLEDGILTEEESNYIFDTFNEIVNPDFSDDENIDFNGKTFCITGEFKCATKQEISKKLQELGGTEKKGVSSKLDYLIVGGVGSDAWKFGKIGGKQAKAQELNEKDANIKIIDEDSLKI